MTSDTCPECGDVIVQESPRMCARGHVLVGQGLPVDDILPERDDVGDVEFSISVSQTDSSSSSEIDFWAEVHEDFIFDRNDKGHRTENKARRILQAAYGTIAVERTTAAWNNDLWNVGDVMVAAPSHFKLVQVKANGASKKAKDRYEHYAMHLPPYVRVELWERHDRQGWEVYELDRGIEPEVVDEPKPQYDYYDRDDAEWVERFELPCNDKEAKQRYKMYVRWGEDL